MGEILTRTVPNTGTVLQYNVLEKHENGNVIVQPIMPQGYPQMPSFTAHISKFDKK